MDSIKKELASKLLQIKAIKLQPNDPFTWASGWKSPFYCDNRKTLSYPDIRSSKPKDHGLENLIEGEMKQGSKVVVIEDLISTGLSSLKAVEAIRKAGGNVIGMVAAYTYGFPVAAEAFKNAGVELITLTDYEHVVRNALETGYIQETDTKLLHEWREDPSHWKR